MPLFVGLALGACRKPETDLGLDLVDDRDPLGVTSTDTLTLLAYAEPEPPVRTSALSRNVLGSYLDREFGSVATGIVTQVRLSTNNVGQGQDNSGLVADSLVLALAYDASRFGYGNLGDQVFRVFEVTEDLLLDSIYQETEVPVVALQDLVNSLRGEFEIRPFDSVSVGDGREVAQLRIPLKASLADRLLGAFGTSDMVDNAAFLDFFKGLWILPDNPDLEPYRTGALHFSLLSATSRMTLYYRNTLPGAEDTLSFDFLINDNCVRYTTARQDHTMAQDPHLEMLLADSTLGGERTYVQSLGGVRTRVAIPHLTELSERPGLALARGELVVPVVQPFYPFLTPPTLLFIFRTDEEGNDQLLPDQLLGQGVIGGEYDADAGEYRFNITRYLQRVITGEFPNNPLSLVPGSGGVQVDRAVLAGPQHPDRPMKLELTFTEY
ncbi:MAG TPA: DUF4270 family protein [Flavobacteriales bacterium]|nr:DUF4270 family protein [Flavobacteriales bacterium]MCB9200748.1 DUF4270 family protein [Flavobacteriales bacterium]HOP43826.1 DUF4270 family protein [Flavobacteriales bacterium]HRW89745.1 DUF4270 family protein [Flavobacteriales bacterium]